MDMSRKKDLLYREHRPKVVDDANDGELGGDYLSDCTVDLDACSWRRTAIRTQGGDISPAGGRMHRGLNTVFHNGRNIFVGTAVEGEPARDLDGYRGEKYEPYGKT